MGNFLKNSCQSGWRNLPSLIRIESFRSMAHPLRPGLRKGSKSQEKLVTSYMDDPTVFPKQHEEINVVVRPEENINHDKDCRVG